MASVIEFVAEPRPAAGTMVGGATGELARAFDRFCTPEQLARGSQTPPAELTSCNVGGDGRSDPPTSTADCGGGARVGEGALVAAVERSHEDASSDTLGG